MPSDDPGCADLELLLQAELDGELDAAAAATVARHVDACESCRRLRQNLVQLRRELRSPDLRQRPPADLESTLRQRLAAEAGARSAGGGSRQRPRPWRAWRPWQAVAGFAAGAALAASAFLLLAVPGGPTLEQQVVAGHVRSLQAEHLFDVASSDRHTVKPWFNGRIDFVPPVRDFADQGYPLAGGRLDYLDGHDVAALVYRHGRHPINVFVWPEAPHSGPDGGARCTHRSGYQVCRWQQGGMNVWAVSDVDADAMRDFAALWKGS